MGSTGNCFTTRTIGRYTATILMRNREFRMQLESMASAKKVYVFVCLLVGWFVFLFVCLFVSCFREEIGDKLGDEHNIMFYDVN